MAPKDIYTFSSSSPRPFTTYNMSSPLPSPSDIFTKKVHVFRAGSRAIPTPQNATASFTNASRLPKLDNLQGGDTIRSFRLGAEDDDLLDMKDATKVAKPESQKSAAHNDEGDVHGKVAKKHRKTAAKEDDATTNVAEIEKSRKSRIKKVEEEPGVDGAVKGKAPRKSRAKKVEGEANPTKDKAVRKPRAKKADGGTQMKLRKAQVTKASTSKAEDGSTKTKNGIAIEDDPFANSLDYGLVEAVKRRTNWTPPPPTVETTPLAAPTPVNLLDGRLSSGCSKASVEKSNVFQDLFGSFGFRKLGSDATTNVLTDGAGTRKRKLIELVKTNISTSTTAPAPKAKAPKKKARTITQLATSAYADEDEEPAKPAPLLQYFPLKSTDRITSDGFKIPPKPRSKSPVKGGKGTAQAPILLSPESALKQVSNQDFLFGTSSQLAREESPTFLRDIHAAMQASNEMDDNDPFMSPTQFGAKDKTIRMMNRNLWSAAARDGSGKLLDVETVDLAVSPAVRRHCSTSAAPERDCSQARQDDSKTWHDVAELAEALTQKATADDSSKSIGPVETAIRLELLSSPSSIAKPSAQPATQSKAVSLKTVKIAVGKPSKALKAKDLGKPDFEAYTMAKLAKEVASYHFKPVKSRDQMIKLLEKCWEGKQRIAMGDISTNLPISSPNKKSKSVNQPPASSQAQAASPKRPRGRPKTDSTATPSPKQRTKTASVAAALSRARKLQKKAEALDEISDSDTAPAPSPPRRHPSQIGTPPLPLQLSSSASVDTRELSPTASQIRLFKYITTAVKSAPPSTDSSNPSWHEKILLYDPIILEDLTVWLNTGALEKAGWDGEVDPKEVKKWCESKSICCLWKENLRGGPRSRY